MNTRDRDKAFHLHGPSVKIKKWWFSTVLAECYYSAKTVENNEMCCVLKVYFSVVKDSVTSVSFSLESVRLAVG